MVTIKRERQIFLLRISPSVYPKKAPPESLDNILKIIKDIYDEKRALFYVRDGANLTGAAGDESSDALQEKSNDERNAIYIANMEISRDRAVMLINRGDPNLGRVLN